MILESKARFLSTIDLFQDLEQRELTALAQTTTVYRARKGKIFYRSGEPAEMLYLLHQGRVQVYRLSPEGKKLVLATLHSGAIFGEMALVGRRRSTFAEAMANCVVYVISRKTLKRLMLHCPQLAMRMLEMTGHRLSEVEQRLEELAFKDVSARVASLLLRMDAYYDDDVICVSHQELADTVGAYRETATLVIRRLRNSGLIETGHKRIRIINRDGLGEVAGLQVAGNV